MFSSSVASTIALPMMLTAFCSVSRSRVGNLLLPWLERRYRCTF